MSSQPAIELAFGYVMRELRKQKSFSQEKLANICDLDRTFISLLERGKRQPSLKTIFALSKALSTTPSELIQRVENQLSQQSP